MNEFKHELYSERRYIVVANVLDGKIYMKKLYGKSLFHQNLFSKFHFNAINV